MEVDDHDDEEEQQQSQYQPAGRRLLQELSFMGLRPSQTNIDVREELRRDVRLIPREDGRTIDRDSGQLIDANRLFDENNIDAWINSRTVISKAPNFPFARKLSGLLGLDVFEMIKGDSHMRAQRTSKAVQDALKENLKTRNISTDQRQELLKTLVKQQVELGELREHLQRLYATMLPTVKRFYFLASITGYPFNPEIDIDDELRSYVNRYEPFPYWLLVRYIRLQYAGLENLVNFAVNDSLYWEAYRKPFQWIEHFLSTYQSKVLATLAFATRPGARTVANHIYLFLRDRAFSTCLRLVPPIDWKKHQQARSDDDDDEEEPVRTKGGPTPKGLAHVSIEKHAWLNPPPRDSIRGRYYNLAYYLDSTRAVIMTDSVNPNEIRLRAITRNEALRVNPPDSFSLSPPNMVTLLSKDLMIGSDRQPGPVTVGSFSTLVYLLDTNVDAKKTQPLVNALNTALLDKKKAIHDDFVTWVKEVDLYSDAIGGLNLEGLFLWIDLVDRVLCPISTAVPPQQTLVADFLFSQAHSFLADVITWKRKDAVASANSVLLDTSVAADPPIRNILEYILCHRENTASAAERHNTGVAFTKIATDNPAAPTTHFQSTLYAGPKGGHRFITTCDIPAQQPCPKSLIDATETLAKRLGQMGGVTIPVVKIREAIHFVLTSLVFWSRLLQNREFTLQFCDTLNRDLLTRNDLPAMVLLMRGKKNKPVSSLLGVYEDQVVPLLEQLNRFRDFSATFYRELFRSTFLSPYSRDGIQDTVRDADGDIDPDVDFSRGDSRNETVFTTTWERLYANLFLWKRDGPQTYWRPEFKALVDGLLVHAAEENGPNESIFTQMWDAIMEKPRLYGPEPLASTNNGVPVFRQVHLALDGVRSQNAPRIINTNNNNNNNNPRPVATTTQEAAVQQAFYQSLAQVMQRKFNPDIVPERLFQPKLLGSEDMSESVPPIDLLQHMIIFTMAYYPRIQGELLKRQREIDQSIADANDYLRSNAANDKQYVYNEVNTIMQNLYVPERSWYMQGILTGRLEIESFLTSALGLAYNNLQALARASLHQSDSQWNRNGKRRRPLSLGPELDYSHLLDVPVDVLSAYTGTGDPTCDYLDVTDSLTLPSTIDQLETSMALLVQQYIVKVRFEVPDAYKSRMQFEEAPLARAQALKGMLPYHFTSLGNRAWRVEIV